MGSSIFCRKLGVHFKQRFLQQCRTGYIVLLPEVNPDIPDQNPLFKSGLPDVENLTKEKCVNTLGKYLLDFEHCIREIEDDILTSKDQKKDLFEVIVEPLEALGAPLETTWGLVKTIYLADNKLMPTRSYLALHERARRARSMKYTSHYIYNKFKECDPSKLTEEEQRVVSKFLIEGKLNGLELSGDKKYLFTEMSIKLSEEKDNFRRRAQIAAKQFKHTITDANITKEFPEELLKTMAQDPDKSSDGPWTVTLSPSMFPKFMEYCPDRELRCNAWLASRQVSSTNSKPEVQNSNSVEIIRRFRRDQAKVLGYETFVHMSMETKVARPIENVRRTLSMFLDKAKPAQEKEVAELKEFAMERGFKSQLQIWDVPYWAREQKKALYGWDESSQREYFPLDKVFSGLLQLCSNLFSLKFVEDPEVSTWHPDVKFYHIFEGEARKPVAGFYFDPYQRLGKMHGNENLGHVVGIRACARAYGPVPPLSALVFNFVPPQPDRPCLLEFSGVETLFRKFGTALQHILSTVNYSEVSGLTNIEWDAVEVVSNVMSLWLNNKTTLSSISGHYQTGEPLPITDLETIRRHMSGYNLCSELYLSSVDLQLHSSSEFWLNIVKQEWPKHFVFPLDKTDSHVCSFTSSIAGELSAGYYSQIWARMLAADAYSSFLTPQADMKVVGQRFRDTFLAFGGSCHPTEVFRRFQGRDPTPEAYIKSLGFDK